MSSRKLHPLLLGSLSLAAICLFVGCKKSPAGTVLSDQVRSLPILVSEDAPPSVHSAAKDLARYIELMTGARPEIFSDVPESASKGAIWVGYQPALAEVLPGVDLRLNFPEEIRIVIDKGQVAIFGRDRSAGGTELEFGTANAVYTFVQDQLGVRWFWPGELGQDVPKKDRIELTSLDFRYHPQFRQRVFTGYARTISHLKETQDWLDLHQRGRGSLTLDVGHAFTDWWELYQGDHPEIFAMRDVNDRTPETKPTSAKLCVSNPKVSELWLKEAVEQIAKDPTVFSISATPNDGGGWCLCEVCRSWDHPQGPPSEYTWGGEKLDYVMLTDRYVRFWNGLARLLKERYPDKELYLGALAYARYRTPPVEAKLEDNILLGYVGSFPSTSPDRIKDEKSAWLQWAKQAPLMMYRPNLFWYTGGPWGLPNVFLKQTAEDFHFLAENRCVGLYVDTFFFNWAAMGPQLYLFAQMAYTPRADGAKIMSDYYDRAFGPAAGDIAAYYESMEKVVQEFMRWEKFAPSGGIRYVSTDVFPKVFSEDILNDAEKILKNAAAKVTDDTHRRRVEFVRAGLDFTRLQLRIMTAMKDVRETAGKDKAAIARAQAVLKEREEFFAKAPPFAVDGTRIMSQIKLRNMEDYLGPIAEKFLNAEAQPPPATSPPQKWDRDLDAG